jgi:hypothetical protein
MLEIADHLHSSHGYSSLGMLGLASRSLHQDITPLFYETMVCDRGWRMDWELKNGRMIQIQDHEKLPLSKWKHAK